MPSDLTTLLTDIVFGLVSRFAGACALLMLGVLVWSFLV